MNIRAILNLLLAVISYLVTDSVAIPIIFIFLYFVGFLILKGLKQDARGLSVFFITYSASLIYALVLFIYMQYNGYEYLQSFDGIDVYIPYTQELLDSNSFIELISTIYDTSRYTFVGSILISFVYVGKLSLFLGGDLYLPMQFLIMLFASLTSVVVYNILVFKRIDKRKSFRYTLIYSLMSVHFIMSTYIVRDMPIALFYALLILLSFKPFTAKRTLLMVTIVAAIISVRLSSGIFASIYILVAIFLADKRKNEWQRMASFIFVLASISVLFLYVDFIVQIFEEKGEHYAMLENEDQGGDSTLKAFDVLPLGISHLAKATFNQFMPIPSWRSMIETSSRPESYNVMNFPNVINTIFRYMMWGVIIIGLFFKKFQKILIKDKLLFYHFIIGVVFLMVQSSTMGHRRMMGVYPVFFLVALLLYSNFSPENKKQILGISAFVFFSLQIFGIFYLI